MIDYGGILRFNLFLGKWSYTNMFTNSYIQESNTFTKIGLYKLETDKWQQRKDLCEFDP